MSERQREILRLLYGRYEAKQIARELNLSTATIRYHLAEARVVLGVSRSADAARLLAEYEGIADYQSLLGKPLIVADLSGTRFEEVSGSIRATAGASVPDRVSEPAVLYAPPTLASGIDIPWPFPTIRRPHNDVSPPVRIVQILICAIVVAVLSIGVVVLVRASQQVLTDIL